MCLSQVNEDRAIDKAFNYVNTKLCQPAVWFDNFFVDDRIEDDSRAGTIVRWYNDFSISDKDDFGYKTKLKLRFNLPKVTKKLKVVFESDEEELHDLLPSNSDDFENQLGLRYDWIGKGRSSFNIKATFRPSIEARYQYTYPFSNDTVGRISQKIYQKKKVTGESTQVDLEHSFSKKYLLRWTNYASYDDERKGWEFATGTTFYHYISQDQALSYKASLSGYNRPNHYIDNTKLSITYRHNFLRDWLFYELTPEYNWNKDLDSETEPLPYHYTEAKVTFRLEVLFHNI
ncbi:hypothetical protein L4C33_14030 [Vibrio makurazakiensis]